MVDPALAPTACLAPAPPAVFPRAFFARDAATVARALLGASIVHDAAGGTRRARIVETEAYLDGDDLACHGAKGRTPRTEVLFGAPGVAYVYLIYGMHHLLNVVCNREGIPAAVLLRAAEPIRDVPGDRDGPSRAEGPGRMDGPGRLSRALGVTVGAHNRVDLCDRASPLRLEPGTDPSRIQVTPRVGVAYSGIWAAAALRFVDVDSPCVSRWRWR